MAVYESTAYTLYKERRLYVIARDGIKQELDTVKAYGPESVDQYEERVNTLTKLLHAFDSRIEELKKQMNALYGKQVDDECYDEEEWE